MADLDQRPCEECGKTFSVTRPNKRFCSEACRRKAKCESIRAGLQAARADKRCPQCGALFTPARSDARYCSEVCQKKQYQQDNRMELSAKSTARAKADPEGRRRALERFAERHPDYGKESWARLEADPERYAAARERKRQYYLDHREEQLEKRRDWRRKNPETVLANTIATYSVRHGRDWNELFTELWEAQDGKCYLCGDPLDREKYRAVHLDHAHSCCKPSRSCETCRRGLACRQCNVLIGWVQDDPDRLRRIADNLETANALVCQRMSKGSAA